MKIKVDLITPEKTAFSQEVDSIVAPAADGLMGILPGHAPFLGALGFGELILKNDGKQEFFALAGGFLEVRPGSEVKIFAETADTAGEINLERAKMEAEEIKEKIQGSSADITKAELANLEVALARAVTRVKLAVKTRRRQSNSGTR